MLSRFVLFILVLNVNVLFAQPIAGVVVDAGSQNPLSFVQVVNIRSGIALLADEQGRFQIEAQVGDTIEFRFVGYYVDRKVVVRFGDWFVKLYPLTHMLHQVDVYGKEPLPNIYKSDVAFNEKPTLKKALLHPISFLYFRFSKREKAKQQVRDMIDYEQKMAKVRAVYSKEMLHKYTGWTDARLDDCYAFCNANIELSPGDDEISIRYKVFELIALFRKKIEDH